jgi:hypothetical protein
LSWLPSSGSLTGNSTSAGTAANQTDVDGTASASSSQASPARGDAEPQADAKQWLRCNCNLTCNIISVERQQSDLPRFQMLQDSVTSMFSSKTLGEQLVYLALVLSNLYRLCHNCHSSRRMVHACGIQTSCRAQCLMPE